MQMVGMPIVARATNSGGLTTRSSSKRKKKYHSGRGVEVVVVGSGVGHGSAPRMIELRRIDRLCKQRSAEYERHENDRQHDHAVHRRVLGDRVGEERLPLRLQDRVLAEVLLLLG